MTLIILGSTCQALLSAARDMGAEGVAVDGSNGRPGRRPCSRPGCHRPRKSDTLCITHLRRKRSGKPMDIPIIPHLTPLAERLLARMEPDLNGGCWLWTASINAAGYGTIRVGESHNLAHRASFFAFRQIEPGKLLVCHRCDVRSCINPDHLFLGTHKDNSDDKYAKGRDRLAACASGEAHASAKLTWAAVDEIRRLAGVIPQAEIGKRFGIHQSHVSAVVLRKKWATGRPA